LRSRRWREKQTHGATTNLLRTTVARTENLLSTLSLTLKDCFPACSRQGRNTPVHPFNPVRASQ
jgi:hypothetical protein